MNLTYLALETRRALRSPRALVFTVGMPVLYYFIFSGIWGSGEVGGINAKTALMSSMAAFGAMMGTMFTGARTAQERAVGWQRQLRLTPLTPVQYLLGKGIVGMFVGLIPVLLVSIVGGIDGASLSAGGWVQLVLGVWLSAIPFAVLGLLIGQLATPDTIPVFTMVPMLLCGFLGGLWIPIAIFPHWLGQVAKVLPSYWMADIGHGAVGHGSANLGAAAGVLAAWAIVLGALVMLRYRRDAARG
ncbi:ABC transporter permease [Sciscionella sediminilitoris]|uniref:ABC transporter permease n=1 Tax=Sciscionella sediminilitoris TaxID=1445613 RepID=UPI0004DED085|nr:ABC transporter permease [Sciscionella sp. SE31]